MIKIAPEMLGKPPSHIHGSNAQPELYMDVLDHETSVALESVAGLFGVEVEWVDDANKMAVLAKEMYGDKKPNDGRRDRIFNRKLMRQEAYAVHENGGRGARAVLPEGMSSDDFRNVVELARSVRHANEEESHEITSATKTSDWKPGDERPYNRKKKWFARK